MDVIELVAPGLLEPQRLEAPFQDAAVAMVVDPIALPPTPSIVPPTLPPATLPPATLPPAVLLSSADGTSILIAQAGIWRANTCLRLTNL